ncbi:hypothetical protein C8J56DRAFT_822177 [Mycena floridula]|nr:hypothetical protein C8J56DRAFT_822177 [Mycena floridula]
MIILEDDEQPILRKKDNVASPTLRIPDQATVSGRPTSVLPDYETSQAQHISPTPSSSTSSLPPLKFRRRVVSRFWRAVGIALAIYVALSLAIGVPFIVKLLKAKHKLLSPPPSGAWDGQTLMLVNSGLLPMDASTRCDDWDSMTDGPLYTSTATHSFDKSGSLLIRSNVTSPDTTGITGNLSVSYNTDPSASSIIFSVSFHSSTVDLRTRSHACFSTDGSDRGLTVYLPDNVPSTDRLDVSINVLFPQAAKPYVMQDFATILPLFSHNIGTLDKTIFQAVTIQGGGADIICESLQATMTSVRGWSASLKGTFNVTKSLKLDNIEGPILANIILGREDSGDDDDDDDDCPPTIFDLGTGNDLLDANVTLLAPGPKVHHFVGDVSNFGAPISLNVVHDRSTPASPTQLRVYNNQAETNVTMDHKYFGAFDVQTKLSAMTVKHSEDPSADPTGQKRIRTLKVDPSSPIRTRGWIGWGARPMIWDPSQGMVTVVSSLSPVLLRLGR